ncbi:hypothetical protein M8Z33_12850 [Streptomyces sp. ZAF1911]|uniref:hypothetical protein n=1 Tax=Streptomyces sp. ZAF1911 TaxID=2944129 RepID=UPI00237BE6D9|nr:hypothetical protein [Streptomyces sp. ZAF1911]MDD9377529.1 hypothetical protein [Streptomyces sp. ZAF1911]
MTRRPEVAVVAPLTGPRAAWGAALLGGIERARTEHPAAADWRVHDETAGVEDDVVAGDYAAVVGHSDPARGKAVAAAYGAAGLTCLLPFLPPEATALSWAPDEDDLPRLIVEGAAALGAVSLSTLHDGSEQWTELARRVGEEAAAAGLATAPSAAAAAKDVLAVLAPQELCLRLARAVAPRGPVLIPADCGLGTFGSLDSYAAGLEVWAVHAHSCAVRRADSAVTALARTLTASPDLRGPALTEAVRANSGVLLTARGAPLGEGWRISRLHELCRRPGPR